MRSLQNFLFILNENWVTILVCIGLVMSMYNKTKTYLSKSTDEQIEIAKAQIEQTMLKFITSAEIDFEVWSSAGQIKRSQVIQEVYEKYPILSKAVDQASIIAWIDKQIDNSLIELRKIVKENNKNNE